jgi:uncharacterized protein YlxW (UPF0749 family)
MFGLQDKVLAMIGGGLSIVLAAALAFVMISNHYTVKSLESQRDRAQQLADDRLTDLTQCRANRITLEDATRMANEAVDAAKAASAARVAKLQDAADQAKRDATAARKEADRILRSTGTGDDCRDANTLILEEIKP